MTTAREVTNADLARGIAKLLEEVQALRKAVEVQATHEQREREPRPAPRNRPQQRGGRHQPVPLEVVWAVDGDAPEDGEVPCCSQHKARDGGPRPLRERPDGTYHCTAKKRDDTYCTLEYAPEDGDDDTPW